MGLNFSASDKELMVILIACVLIVRILIIRIMIEQVVEQALEPRAFLFFETDFLARDLAPADNLLGFVVTSAMLHHIIVFAQLNIFVVDESETLAILGLLA